jgi:glycosyltransferase involved in cell wall biosynthesis
MEPIVSVVIPNYNYAHYLGDTLDSVFAQTYSHLELIVVDDGSQDESEALVRSYGKLIRFIRQNNQGVSVARNRGVQESKGQYIAFLDADDLWLPTKLEKQVQRLLDDPEIGLVHCGMQEIDRNGVALENYLDGLEGWVSREMLLLKQPVILGAGSTALVPRATFDALGGFDTRLGTSADWEFCYRVAVRQRIGFVPEVLVRYRNHGNNMHANVKLMEHDILIGYKKAFSTEDPDLRAIRRQSYSNAHMVLAGSYFRAGDYYHFIRHSAKSILYSPRAMTRLLEFPRRFWHRHTGAWRTP